MADQPNLFPAPETRYMSEKLFFKDIIKDRGSKYSVLCAPMVSSRDPQRQAKLFSHDLRKDSFFKKSTHNSYAWRCERDDGFITQGCTDDGEKGAGQCILREMKKAHIVNGLIVVTRYYGGVKLEGDRFRHVIDSAKYIINKIK